MRAHRVAVATVVPLALALAASAGAATPPVHLSRIQYNSPGADTGSNSSLNAEWVRITNSATARRALTGWTLRDAQGHIYRFPTFALAAGASVRVHTGRGTNTAVDLYWRQGGYIWNNSGDTAILRNASGVTVDTCTYVGTSTGVAAPC